MASEGEESGDAELVHRLGTGDSDALSALFDRYAPRVLGLLHRMLGGGGEAEEVLQEVFLQAWSRAGTFSADKGSPRSWLLMMARSRALDRLRTTRAARRRDDRALQELALVEEPRATADLEREELGARMRSLLAALPEEQRQAIELAFFGGLSHSQVSAQLGVPLGTIKSRILIGMRKLRQGLDGYR